jgi:hypothetical protein
MFEIYIASNCTNLKKCSINQAHLVGQSLLGYHRLRDAFILMSITNFYYTGPFPPGGILYEQQPTHSRFFA